MLHGTGAKPRAAIKQGNPLNRQHARRANLQGTVVQDSFLPVDRQGRRRTSLDRRPTGAFGRHTRRRLLRSADPAQGPQQDARVPGRNSGPVVAVTTFKDEAEALEIANDTLYGLGAGVWSRDGNVAYRMGRAIKAGRVWTNCYHAYPAHATFGGYKESGIGR